MKPSLILLAAGMGSRYGGLKQMDGFGPNEETIMDYSIYDAINAGFGKIVFVIRKSFEADFKNFFQGKFDNKVEVHYVCQELEDLPNGFELPEGRQKPWGTSHAVWACRHVVKEPFAVINADDFYGRKSFNILHDFLANLTIDDNTSYTTVSYYLKNTLSDHGTVNRGVCQVDENGHLVSVKECTKIGRKPNGTIVYPENGQEIVLEEEAKVSMNMWGFVPRFFDHTTRLFSDFLAMNIHVPKSEYYIPETIQTLMDEGKATVKVMASDEMWFGVTYQEDKPIVQKSITSLIEKGEYPKSLWS